jgi:hypothetical protein
MSGERLPCKENGRTIKSAFTIKNGRLMYQAQLPVDQHFFRNNMTASLTAFPSIDQNVL